MTGPRACRTRGVDPGGDRPAAPRPERTPWAWGRAALRRCRPPPTGRVRPANASRPARNDHGVQPDEGLGPPGTPGAEQDLLRPPPRTGHSLHDRDVGALQLLRHEGPAPAVPGRRPSGLHMAAPATGARRSTPSTWRWCTCSPCRAAGSATASGARARRSPSPASSSCSATSRWPCPPPATFFAGLGLVALGSGLLKANISTMVGHLYDGPDDPRRDGGFTRLLHGHQPRRLRRAAGHRHRRRERQLAPRASRSPRVGMALGLVQFLLGTRHLSARAASSRRRCRAEEKASTLRKGLIWLAVAAVFYAVVGFTGNYTLNWVLVPLTLARPDHPDRGAGPHQARQGADRRRAVQDVRLHLVLRRRRRLLDDLRPGRLDPVDLRRALQPTNTVLRLRLPGLLVPVGEPGLHHGAGPGLRLAVAVR